MKITFVTWDGPDQDYLSALFLPIFVHLKREYGYEWTVLQFGWGDGWDKDGIANRCAEAGIAYEPVEAMRRPLKLATLGMFGVGARHVLKHVREHRTDVVMPRSLIPSAMVQVAARLTDLKVCFDADGFMADERVDFGGWSKDGLTYKMFRTIERHGVRSADSIITRTAHAREILARRATLSDREKEKIVVVPNGKSEEAFVPLESTERHDVRRERQIPAGSPWIVYAGSLGPHYYPNEIVEFFSYVRERSSDAKLTVLTGNPDQISDRFERFGIEPEAYEVTRVAPEAVGPILGAADLGIALRKATFSQRGVAPIKVGEYLMSGLPVLSTAGVGDLDEILDNRVGYVLKEPTPSELQAAASWFVEEILPGRDGLRVACRERGVDAFGMKACGRRYRDALENARR